MMRKIFNVSFGVALVVIMGVEGGGCSSSSSAAGADGGGRRLGERDLPLG